MLGIVVSPLKKTLLLPHLLKVFRTFILHSVVIQALNLLQPLRSIYLKMLFKFPLNLLLKGLERKWWVEIIALNHLNLCKVILLERLMLLLWYMAILNTHKMKVWTCQRDNPQLRHCIDYKKRVNNAWKESIIHFKLKS